MYSKEIPTAWVLLENLLLLLAVLKMEPKTFCLLGNCSTTKLHPQLEGLSNKQEKS